MINLFMLLAMVAAAYVLWNILKNPLKIKRVSRDRVNIEVDEILREELDAIREKREALKEKKKRDAEKGAGE